MRVQVSPEGHSWDFVAAEGPEASSIGHNKLETTAAIESITSLHVTHLVFLKKQNMASLFPRHRNSNSSYLRFDIYEDLSLFYVRFLEFQKGIDNSGKLWVVYSYSVNVNRWSFVRDSSS